MIRRLAPAAWLALVLSSGFAAPAGAHPHVWVAVETTVIYDKGAVTALRHRWLFDEYYSSMAIEDLDTNKDGKYDRTELAELAKVNMEGLKEFGYFTVARLGDQELSFSAPTEYWMEMTEGVAQGADAMAGGGTSAQGGVAPSQNGDDRKRKVLALEFTLPLTKPVLAEAEGFTFSIADPSFFIWFDFAKGEAVKLAGAPAGCRASISEPGGGVLSSQKLGDQAQALGFGMGAAKTVTLSCPK
jgi:ABC-type uncharacterized transport system substrate-binding protein